MALIDIFPWNDNFNTGLQKVDEQHRKLVQLLNLLASHVAFKADIPSIDAIFEQLADYAVYHFQTEESIWHQYLPDDPLEAAHKSVHDSFIETVSKLKAEETTKPRDEVIEEVLAFLTNWLASHILENDRYLAQVVLARQSGMPLELAKQHAKEQMGGLTKVLISIILSAYETVTTNTLNLMRELARRGREEDALRRKQELLLLLLDTSPIAIRIGTLSGDKVLFANARYAELVNAEINQVIGAHPKQFYAHPQDYDDVLDQISQGKAVTDKLVELSVSGAGTVWTLATYLKIDYENGPAVLGWFYDVSRIRETEASLTEAYNLLKAIIDTVPMRIFWKDKDLRYLGCNPVFAHDAGEASPEDVIGKDDYQLGWKAQAVFYRTDDRQVMDTGIPKLFYAEPQTKPDGGTLWLRTSKVPLRNANNETVGVLGVYQDITEQKLMEDVLRKLSLAVEQSPSSIVITDLDARIEFVNEAFVRETGYSRAEAIGQNPRLLQSGKTPRKTYDEMWEVLGRDKSWEGEFVNKRKDGSEYTEMALISPVHQPDGRATHYLAIKEDITERKILERQLADQLVFTQAVIDAEVDGVAVCHSIAEAPYTRFTVWNRSMETLTGFTLEEINRLGWYQSVYIDPEVQDQARQRMERMRQGDHIRGEEWVITRKNGEKRVAQIFTTICAHDAQGHHVLAVMHDITERKQAETALHDSNQQLFSLLNSMAEGAYGVDTQGNCRFVNRSFLRILGYESADEVIGTHIHELIHHSHPDGSPYPAAECRMYAAYRCNEEIYVADEVFWRKDGTAVPVEYWSQPIITDGVMTGAIATFVDITGRKQIEAKLIENESRLRAIIDNEPECIKIIDAQGYVVMMNPAGLDMIEADTLGQVIGKPVLNMIAPKYRQAYAELQQRVLAGEAMQIQYEILGFKGACRWLETHAVPMKEANGNVMLLAVTRDISERKKAEQQLRIAAIVFESQEGMMVTDADNVILQVNKAFTDITGYSAEEIVGKDPRILHSGREGQEFFTAMWESVHETGAWHGEIWNRRKNGEIYPQYLTITAVKDQEGVVTHHVGTLTDITLRKSAEEKIERLAFYDPLTNLPNRRLLQDRLKSALASSFRHGRKGALLFIDLDNFKTLNDTLGHDMGDLLLQQVAERLVLCVREVDTVARLGGDEFVVMLEELGSSPTEAAKQAETIGNKILATINQPFKLVAHSYHSTPSIGITLFNGHDHSVDDLLKQADIAMYQAKMSGRNALRFFDQRMQDTITRRVLMEEDLRKALADGQFELHYQIQVDGSWNPMGAEALIRWSHPKLGLVPPAEFLPLAEETGLILPIGQWVLESVCAQLKAWQQAPPTRGLGLSLNISAKQFFQEDFVLRVQAAIAFYGVDPKLLKLELTEGMLLENIEETIATMNTLGDMGIQFSLDDFGTGYSSLQYLKKLPINQLKIDQSFVQDISINNNDKVIVRTIIAMASNMDVGVIAEGVETEGQRQFLFENGCLHYQGYLFGKPLPIAQFERLVGEWGSYKK
ncbi:bacteriohemerythrin [Methylovulum miyakonense]|uniref:bacteriohemerythrin n=1 Tax=Methylovulum miyakonense TaxID=645578 RepID=UPI00035CACAA|nr:bacteriohemerythrin [Methylovulum miyakonense]